MVDTLKQLGKDHWDWVERMGWHNKTPLETIALIGSEIGEVAGELLADNQLKLAEELADVLLRCVDMAETYDIDLDHLVDVIVVDQRGLMILKMMVTFQHLVNSARYQSLGEEFAIQLATLAKQAIIFSEFSEFNIFDEARRKMKMNELRGNRGRIC